MKRNLIRLFTITLVLFTAVSGAYAKGNTEKKSVDFSNLDLTCASSQTIINSFENLQNSYNEKKQNLLNEIQKAYEKNDADKYFALKKEYAELHFPALTKEESSKIQENIQVSGDQNLAMWLYKNSPWYRPSLTLKASVDGKTFTKTISVLPGTEITVPDFKTTDTWIFKGWQKEDSTEITEAETKINMPLSDTVYNAVFELSPDYKNGKNLNLKNADFYIDSNSMQTVEITFNNNGTETLENIQLSLSTDDPLLYVMTDNLYARLIKTGSQVTARFSVITKAQSGTSFNAVVKATGKDGTVLEEPVTITVR